jgi:hypothetical protein
VSAFQAGLILLRIEQYEHADKLSGTDRLVLAVLFSFAADVKDEEPLAYPSVSKVVARSGLGRRTVQTSLGHLEDVGAVTGQHRHRKPTIWSLAPVLRKAPVGVPEPGDQAGTSAGAARGGAGAAHVMRGSGTQQARQRRSTSAGAALQCTEEGSGLKVRNRPDVSDGSTSGDRSLREAAPSSPPPGEPPPLWAAGPPPGIKPLLNGVEVTP